MNDVLDRLASLRSPEHPTDTDTVAADVRRGRRALHRRRAARGGLVAACAVAVAGMTSTALREPASQVQPHDGLRLVTYTGEQLPGFTIAKVPEGFVLQGATSYNLNVTRPGDTSSIDDFRDKIVVMLEWNQDPARQDDSAGATPAEQPDQHGAVKLERTSDRYKETFKDGHVEFHTLPHAQSAPEPPAVEAFDVDATKARITTNEEGTSTLRYVHGDYTLAIQVWPTLGLTKDQLIEFADGVSVTGDARPGLG